MDDATFTTNAATLKVPTIAEMLETVRYMERKYPAPTPPDPKKCLRCKEEMSEPAMSLTSGVGVFAPVIGHLCGRCAVVIKRECYYGRREGVMMSVRRYSPSTA